MELDRTTLHDLAILDEGEDGISLFALVDRTRTRLGRERLRARMRNLPATPDELAVTQHAIMHLAARLEAVREGIDRLQADAVADYLQLRFQAVTRTSRPGRLVERWLLRLRYRLPLRSVERGVSRLSDFLAALPPFTAAMGSGSTLLSGLLVEMREHLEGMARLGLPARRGKSLASVLEADRIARGRARESILGLLRIIAEIDALQSLASATAEHGWTMPDVAATATSVDLMGLRHPGLPGAVGNDVLLRDGQRVLAVTGPNMAGKSTLLKAVGIAVYLGHLGGGVPARRARMPWFDNLVASLYVRDSLSRGRSFFLSEVLRIKDLLILLQRSPRVCAIVDEPFKGTNVHDASEATGLLLDGLCAQSSSAVVLATHLATVVRDRALDGRLATGYLGATEIAGMLEFDYRLHPGVSEQRLGMVLLEREGVLSALNAAISRSPVES